MKRLTGFAAVAALAATFTFGGEKQAEAQMTTAMQTQVNQILASGGPNLIANLAALAQTNQDVAFDILVAGCASGVNCFQLMAAMSQFIDAELLVHLQAVAQRFDNTVFNRGGFDILTIAEGGTENPAQTSGTEPASNQ